MGRIADINKFTRPMPGIRTNAATHSTSTGGDPLKIKKPVRARGGKVSSRKRTTTRKRGR